MCYNVENVVSRSFFFSNEMKGYEEFFDKTGLSMPVWISQSELQTTHLF